ncbi:hypothetical protein J6590_045908 [Homalodisca vitripennis]|nr:hypothetical protein J6590_045908 [Homalodisca vitripennis]
MPSVISSRFDLSVHMIPLFDVLSLKCSVLSRADENTGRSATPLPLNKHNPSGRLFSPHEVKARLLTLHEAEPSDGSCDVTCQHSGLYSSLALVLSFR